MEIDLRQVPSDDPQMLGLAQWLRDEVEERDAYNGAARPDIPLAEAVKRDSDTLVAYAGREPVGMGALTRGARAARQGTRPACGPPGHERAPPGGESHVLA